MTRFQAPKVVRGTYEFDFPDPLGPMMDVK